MFKNNDSKLPVIGLIGNKKVGKTTQAKFLKQEFGYEIFNHADKVRDLTCRILSTYTGLPIETLELFFSGDTYEFYKSKNFSLEGLTLNKGTRPLLQGVGNECREVFGNNVWVNILMETIKDVEAPIVIADIRYLNEMINCYDNGILTIHLSKKDSDTDHPSEQVERRVNEYYRKPDFTFDYELGEETIATEIRKIVTNYNK